MDLLTTPAFWLCAAAIHLLMRLPVPLRRSLRFGALNALVVGLLCGPRALCFILGLGTVLWLCLRQPPEKRAPYRLLALSGLALLFLGYKTWQLRPEPTRLTAYQILAGVSFSYVFLRAVDLCRVVSSGAARLLDPLSLTGYLLPFHMLVAGPINPYQEHVAADAEAPPPPALGRLVGDVHALVTGLFLKFVVADGFRLFFLGREGDFHMSSFSDAACLHVYLYLEFAGYSAAAVALGRLCQVPTPENFRYPLLSPSVTEYWNRWHISLGTFVRKNIFYPLQVRLVRRLGRKRAVPAAVISLTATFAFVGIWHRLGILLCLWGAAMGLLMALERLALDRLPMLHTLRRRPIAGPLLALCGIAYTFSVITLGLWFSGRAFRHG